MDEISSARTFFEKNPDIEVLKVFDIDVNGLPRGIWNPQAIAEQLGLRTTAGFPVDLRLRDARAEIPGALYKAHRQRELSTFSVRVTDVEYDAHIRTV